MGLLAVGGAGGISQVWSTQPTPRLIADLSDGEATTYAMAFDGAGRRLITGDSDGRLALFDLGDPENPARLAVAELGYPITGLAFTPAGRRVVVSGAVDQLVTWRVGDASLEPEQELPFDKQELVRGNDVTLSPDGQWVVASLTQAALLRWRIVGDEFVWADRLTGFGSWVNGAAFSADSSTMLVGSSDQSVSVFDVRTGLKTRTLFGPSPITGVGYAAGRIVATSTDGSLWVWPEEHRILRASGPPIYQLASDPQGERWLAAGVGGERRVLLWDIASGLEPRQPALAPEGVHLTSSAVIDPRGGWVHAGARGGKVVSWPLTDAGAGSPRVQQLAEEGTFARMAFSPDGRVLAAGQYTGRNTIIATVGDDGTFTQVATVATDSPQDVSFSADGRLVQVSVGAEAVQLFDVSTPQQPRLVGSIPVTTTAASAFSSVEPHLVVATATGEVTVWDVADPAHPREIRRFEGPAAPAEGVTFSPDGQRIALAAPGELVSVFDLTAPGTESAFTLDARAGSATAVQFLGGSLLAGAAGGGVRVWTTDPQDARRELCGRRGTPLTQDQWRQHLPGIAWVDPCV